MHRIILGKQAELLYPTHKAMEKEYMSMYGNVIETVIWSSVFGIFGTSHCQMQTILKNLKKKMINCCRPGEN